MKDDCRSIELLWRFIFCHLLLSRLVLFCTVAVKKNAFPRNRAPFASLRSKLPSVRVVSKCHCETDVTHDLGATMLCKK